MDAETYWPARVPTELERKSARERESSADSGELTVSSATRASAALKAVTLVALLFTFGNALWAAWDQGITYDEYFHLEWPRRLFVDRVDERDSAIRFDSKTPALLPAALAARALELRGIRSEQALRFASRLVPIFYLGLCIGAVALLARSPDRTSAWIAILLMALEPNMAANASIATADVAYAVTVALVALALLRPRDSWTSACLVGAALGLAFSAKYSAVLLAPVVIVDLMVWGKGRTGEIIRRLALIVGTACLTTSFLYLFVGVGVPLGSIEFRTPELKALASFLPSVPVPFPRSILTGIDISKDHNDHLGWNCYLFGEIHERGVWYYFLAHWLMKTPIALLVALSAGFWEMRRSLRERSVALVAAIAGIHLFYFSFLFSTQLGFRYALACVPLACVIAARGLSRLLAQREVWLIPLALLTLLERLPYFADPIAFTNLLVWPKSRAYWYTADSNLDYGQNRERLERYVKESGLSAVADQAAVTPGLYVVSANDLTKFGNFKSHRWLIDHDIPVTRFGFTHFGFSITGDRFEAFMNETRAVPPLLDFEDLCSGSLAHYAPGSQIPFVRDDHPDGGRLWVVCVRSKKGADVGLTVKTGRLLFGKVLSDSSCATDFLQAKQAAWLRVPGQKGVALCIRELPFRRTSLRYLVDSYLTVRGQGADVEIRQVPVSRLRTPFGQGSG